MDNSTGIYQLWSAIANINSIGIINITTEIPDKFSLYQNYPNPFNPVTKIKFDFPPFTSPLNNGGEWGSFKVFDITGREITTLLNEKLQPGTYEVNWMPHNIQADYISIS